VNVVFGVEPFDALEKLVGKHERCFKGEFFAAHEVQIFKGGAEKVGDHEVETILVALPMDLSETIGAL
jgi:hypothetical protein